MIEHHQPAAGKLLDRAAGQLKQLGFSASGTSH